jgi:DNA-binding NarL/FixJ family response regulator
VIQRKASAAAPISAQQRAEPRQRPAIVYSRDDAASGGKDYAAPARILIVEDDFLVASDMEAALTEAGFTLAGVASSAEEAVELAKAEQPAMAVMDIRLAGKRDGIDAALELFRTLGIRCVFATAHYDDATKARAEPARPLAWVPKPYAMTSLVDAVRAALKETGRDSV